MGNFTKEDGLDILVNCGVKMEEYGKNDKYTG